jgi:hypothetical protein
MAHQLYQLMSTPPPFIRKPSQTVGLHELRVLNMRGMLKLAEEAEIEVMALTILYDTACIDGRPSAS